MIGELLVGKPSNLDKEPGQEEEGVLLKKIEKNKADPVLLEIFDSIEDDLDTRIGFEKLLEEFPNNFPEGFEGLWDELFQVMEGDVVDRIVNGEREFIDRLKSFANGVNLNNFVVRAESIYYSQEILQPVIKYIKESINKAIVKYESAIR